MNLVDLFVVGFLIIVAVIGTIGVAEAQRDIRDVEQGKWPDEVEDAKK